MIYFIIVVAVIILILILNYLIYRRSIITTAVEIGIRFFTPFKKRNLEKQIARKNKLIAKGYKPPKLKCNIKKEMFDGMEVYILSSNEKQSNKVIFYLYGGCYVSLPIYFHWKFLDRLVRKTGTTLILPIYPLAPECKCEETISKVNSLYLEVCKLCNKNIILMGDSSGGGLSILTYVNATKNNIKKPSAMILFSPWVDLSLTNQDAKYLIPIDPMIGLNGLVECRDVWLGDNSINDGRFNPMCADVCGIENTYIFAGTRELAYPDIVKFYDKCNKDNVNINLVIVRGMNHNFVLYPMPTSLPYFNRVVKIISEVDSEK